MKKNVHSACYGVVYRVTCTLNQKQYHGQTVNPAERFAHHLREDSHCHALRNAVKKYGRDNFIFEIVARADSKEQLDELEKQFVATSVSPVGYNLKEGGANGRPSLEARKRMSDRQSEIQARPEVRAKNSEGVKKAMARPDVKKRLGASLKEYAKRPGVKEAKSQLMKEVHARLGEKEKRSQAQKDVWASYSNEERQARIDGLKAIVSTPEYKAKMSEASRKTMSDPIIKEKHRKALALSFTDERRLEMSDHMKEVHARPGEKQKRGAAIARAHSTPEGKRKLASRRRCGESEEARWARIENTEQPS